MGRHAIQKQVAHRPLQYPLSACFPQKLLVPFGLHQLQVLVISSALRAGTGNTVQIPAVQRVTSQFGLIFVELGHGEVKKVR